MFAESAPAGPAAEFDRASGGLLTKLIESDDITGKKGEFVTLHAPAGVKAGKAAGFKVVGLVTSHTVEQLREAGADWIVRDLRSVRLKGWDSVTGMASVEISDALVS